MLRTCASTATIAPRTVLAVLVVGMYLAAALAEGPVMVAGVEEQGGRETGAVRRIRASTHSI